MTRRGFGTSAATATSIQSEHGSKERRCTQPQSFAWQSMPRCECLRSGRDDGGGQKYGERVTVSLLHGEHQFLVGQLCTRPLRFLTAGAGFARLASRKPSEHAPPQRSGNCRSRAASFDFTQAIKFCSFVIQNAHPSGILQKQSRFLCRGLQPFASRNQRRPSSSKDNCSLLLSAIADTIKMLPIGYTLSFRHTYRKAVRHFVAQAVSASVSRSRIG